LVLENVQSFPIEPVRVSIENLRIAPIPASLVKVGEILAGSAFEEAGTIRSGVVDFLKQVDGQGDGCLDSHKIIIPLCGV
jgi:hypothetical protein